MVKEKEEDLAAQMREAIDYLNSVEIQDLPLRIDVCTVLPNPKLYFESRVPMIRKLWNGTNTYGLEMAVYHFMRFYKAVKEMNYEQQQPNEIKKEPVSKVPVGKVKRPTRKK